MLNSRHSQLRIMFLMMQFCLVHVILRQSHQVFEAQEALIVTVATGLTFKSCSMYICRGCWRYWLFIIMTQAYQEVSFFFILDNF